MENKLDIVYILGTGSKWADNEIRYSLRSVEKYAKFVRRVYVVGEKPRWINWDLVKHIPMTDPYPNKLMNACRKILRACREEKISKQFALMNDDFFLLRDIEEIPYYKRGTLAKTARDHETHAGYYYKALRETDQILKGMGHARRYDFETHIPMIFDKAVFIKMHAKVGKRPYLFRSVYAAVAGIEGVERDDVKPVNTDQMEDVIMRGDEYMSASPSIVKRRVFREWIAGEFPKASKYETDNGRGIEIWERKISSLPIRYFARKHLQLAGREYNSGDIIIGEVPSVLVKNGNAEKVKKDVEALIDKAQ